MKYLGHDPVNGITADPITRSLNELGRKINDPALKSSTRLLIIVTLAINTRMTFTDLMLVTSTGKGSLSHHIQKLQEGGLIRTRTALSLAGPRVMVEITDNGLDVYRQYISLLRSIINPDRNPRELHSGED